MCVCCCLLLQAWAEADSTFKQPEVLAGYDEGDFNIDEAQDPVEGPTAERLLSAQLAAEVRARMELKMSWHPLKNLTEVGHRCLCQAVQVPTY